MAQIKDKVVIEKLFGGWADSFVPSGNGHPLEGMANQYSQSISMCPFTPGYEGHLAPGLVFTAMTDAGTLVNGLPLNAVADSNGTAYVILNNARMVNFTVGNTTIPNSSNNYHDVSGSGVHSGHASFTGTYSDIAIYPQAATSTSPSIAGVDEYVFYSWTDNTDGDVGRRVKSTGVYVDNYLSNVTTQSNGTALIYDVPHPLLVGQDNNLYVGNGRYLASHDPSTGTAGVVNYQALDLKPGWTVSALSNYQNYIAVLGYKLISSNGSVSFAKSEVKLFLWDGFSPSWNFEYYVRDNYAANLLYDGTDLYVVSQGRNNTTKLKRFNGSGFDTAFESSQIGNAPGIGGSDLFLNHIVWGGSNGTINAWGSPSEKYQKGFHSFGLQNNSQGMVKNLGSNVLLIGNNSNGTYTIRYSDTSFAKFDTQAQWTSIFYSLPTNSTITALKFYHSQFGSGASYRVVVVKDYASLAFGGDNLTTITNTAYPSATYVPVKQSIKNVNGFYLGIQWAHSQSTDIAAIIRKIEVEYTYDPGNI